MRIIDKLLNSITMYRLVLYGLIFMALYAVLLGFLGQLPFEGEALLFSFLLFSILCWGINFLISNIFKIPCNSESAAITGCILFFIISPTLVLREIPIFFIASTLAIISKYFFVIHKKHIFNPAAFSVFIITLFGSGMASWWVGTPMIFPFAAIIGFFVARKIHRLKLFFSFIVITLFVSGIIFFLENGTPINSSISQILISWPLFFFAGFMLTEPLTTPPQTKHQIIYGCIIGVLFGVQFQVGPLYSTPQFALLVGNIFSFVISPKIKLKLVLKEKRKISFDVYEFIFNSDKKIVFFPGQYMEWTLPHFSADKRGNRRYFTIASSPTEDVIRLGVKIQNDGSSFKKALLEMKEGDNIIASQLSGEFILPKNKNQKIVFIAGGIGITPFRSMIQYLIDTNDYRDIVLFYSCMKQDDFAYKDLLKKGEAIGVKSIFIITDKNKIPAEWSGETGYLSEEMIMHKVPNWSERIFYLSGPEGMVSAYRKLLLKMGILKKNIKTDYFPGF